MKAIKSIRIVAFIALGTLLFGQVHAQHATTFKFSETAPEYVLRNMEKNANALFSEINRKYDQDESQLNIKTCATEFAQNRIANMWAVSHFYCTRTSMVTRVLKMVSSDTYQVRNIPVCYLEGESQEYQNRLAVLEFDKSGKISDGAVYNSFNSVPVPFGQSGDNQKEMRSQYADTCDDICARFSSADGS